MASLLISTGALKNDLTLKFLQHLKAGLTLESLSNTLKLQATGRTEQQNDFTELLSNSSEQQNGDNEQMEEVTARLEEVDRCKAV